MISKANIQFVKGLQDKKQRQKYDQFTVEGEKSITELLKSDFRVIQLIGLQAWFDKQQNLPGDIKCVVVNEKELKQISVHQTPQMVLAVVAKPAPKEINDKSAYILGLDEIQDPGNLGTIIRIADWYGITQIICSPGSTDVYSPKCINSTMGSFLRVNVCYGDILQAASRMSYPIMVADMEGDNIHKGKLPERGLLVIGNEGHGVNPQIMAKASHRLSIPGSGNTESLNAAVSTAVILDNLLRSKI